MQKKTVILVIIFFLVSASHDLEAFGLRPFELSARAAALGGAFVTRTDDASAIFYNPAALAFSSGIRIETNVYYTENDLDGRHPTFPAPSQSTLGVTRVFPFVSLNIKDRFGLGIGIFSPNSMEIQWPENWTGRALSIRSKLNTLYIRPVVAVKISKHVSLGIGMDFISSDVGWKYDRIFTFQERGSGDSLTAHSVTEVSAKGMGYVAGILIRVSDSLRIGGRYQSKVKLDLEGSNTFIFPPESFYENPIIMYQNATSTITLPQEFVLGIMYSPVKKLTLQLDLQRMKMSQMKQWEFSLDPRFYEEIEDYHGTRPDQIRQGVDLNLRDTSRIMFGVEYRLIDTIIIRAGYSYQKSAVDRQMIHPVFPDLETNRMSFGLGYDGPARSILDPDEIIGGFTFDAYFQYGFSPDSTSTLPELPVTYHANRWTVGLTLGLSFGSL